ncbi:MAG: sulfotransferase family 2 domain-containing protein [Actinobacteria bacterium]|nr:sulfotransferase family 2 domain-containing protein [Actinomycetota bacterium]
MDDRRPKRADLGPVTRAYVTDMGWRSVNLHTHISLVNRYVYVEVPKAGCGTMKATLGGMEAARMGPAMVARVQENPHDRMKATPFVKPFQLPPAMLEDVFTSADFRRFAVVRDPASRLLSGYIEKIGQGLKQSAPIVAAIKDSTGVDIAPADITLDQFLDVVTAQPSRDQDPHWRRQADHLGIGIIEYDDVVHLESLDASWPRIGELTRTPDLQEQFFCRNSTGARTKIADYYTPRLLERVAETYARDYAEFDYPLPTR